MDLVSSLKFLIGSLFFMSVGLSTAQEVGRFGKI